MSHFTNRVIIEHNTVFKNGTTNDSAAGGIGINNVDDVIIRNNISYAEPDHWALGTLALPNTNVSIYNNLLYNENGSEAIYNNLSTGWTEANPLFTDASNEDYTLNATSPAIDAGSTLAGQVDDFQGNLRDDGTPDIGAYEYFVPLSINDFKTHSIKVFPNPSIEKIYVTSDNNNIVSIVVTDLSGKQVILKEQLNSISIIISLEELHSGLYFVKVITDEGSETFKTIKK